MTVPLIYQIIAKMANRRGNLKYCMKVELPEVKNLLDDILTIKQRLKQAEERKHTDEIKHLRNENNSKSTIIKILSENQSWRMLPIHIP